MTPGAKPPAAATERAVVRPNPCVAKVTTAALRTFSRVCERPDPARAGTSVSRRQRAGGTEPSVNLNVCSEHTFRLAAHERNVNRVRARFSREVALLTPPGNAGALRLRRRVRVHIDR